MFNYLGMYVLYRKLNNVVINVVNFSLIWNNKIMVELLVIYIKEDV